jgi:hypothetical protein
MVNLFSWTFLKPFVLIAVVCFTAGLVGYWYLSRLQTPQPVEFISEEVVEPPEPDTDRDLKGICSSPGATVRGLTCRTQV